MVGKLSAYLPQDRLRALARGESLSDRTRGSALFSDISGFTPLTEKLTQQFGARRGVEELTRRINAVYDALIRVVEQHDGSVISFAGDAITCWFDGKDKGTLHGMKDEEKTNPSSFRTVACALAMQEAMRAFPDLAIKVVVTSGTARRLVVGDPQIQLIDTLAGATIARLATAEHLTQRGEVVVDSFTADTCSDALQIQEWRQDAETQERFALIGSLASSVEPRTVSTSSDAVSADTLRSWVSPTVYAREQSGLGEFLTELRPAIALFLRFSGIDYDGDESAQEKLDRFIRQVQHIVAHYDGTLLQLTIGDKGSYFFICFGAPIAHEDDARRAINAAFALREIPNELKFLQPLQIGTSHGTMRVGAYGGITRRTYGAQGDEVNIAARLMTTAASGEILVTAHVQETLGEQFTLEPCLPVTVKGKTNALTVFAVTGVQHHRATRLLEPSYRLPMIGRQDELALIANQLELTRQGQGQIIDITAEAGMGKSRLVAEVIRLANRLGVAAYGGAAESSGTNTAYLVWKAIWQAFFNIDPTAPLSRQLRNLEGEIEDRAPHRLQAMPLLAPMLDLPIDDNNFTRTLEPKDRRNALTALLEDCVKAAAQKVSMLFVLEDTHWIDALSHDLLESLARATTHSRVCFVLAYRPTAGAIHESPLRMETLPNLNRIELNELTLNEAEQLIRAKLAQLYPERGGTLSKKLIEQLTAKAQGNPFFIEELLNYLRERGVDLWGLRDPKGLLELPSSLHTLILSRVDQLSETQKATLKVASIIGRLFPFAWLHGYYPNLGAPDAVKSDLNVLSRLDITPLDTPEPELAYLFKHIVTQEVAYESLAYATRAQLHEQLAQYLEARDADKFLDLLAFHYGRSENAEKQREYFRKAGEAAQAAYANTAAVDYYERLLPLLNEPGEQVDSYLKWGEVFELLGRYDEAEAQYQKALTRTAVNTARRARCQLALGKLNHLRGESSTALVWLEQARVGMEASGERVNLVSVHYEMARCLSDRAEYDQSREHIEISLTLAREGGDRASTALALHHLGYLAHINHNLIQARSFYLESLTLRREISDKFAIAASLSNLGSVAIDQSDYTLARESLEESLALRREIGDKRGVAISLANLGSLAINQGHYAQARELFGGCLVLSSEVGNKFNVAHSHHFLGVAAFGQGDYHEAQLSFEKSLALAIELGNKRGASRTLYELGKLALAQDSLGIARDYFVESLQLTVSIGFKPMTAYNLVGLAQVSLQKGEVPHAVRLISAADRVRVSVGLTWDTDESRMYDETVVAARSALGEETFNAAFEAGQKMTLDEAVKLALEENPSHA